MSTEIASVVTAPPLSVVVISYNRAALLPRALDSILSQPGDDFEVVVVDDGSTDGTPELLQAYAARHGERLKTVRQEHAGAYAASCAAYRAARGKWIIFVDSDDRLRPGAMQALRQAATTHGDVAMVLAGVVSVDAAGRERPMPAPRLHGDRMVNFRNFVSGRLRAVIAGGLIRREHLALFDNPRYAHVHGVDVAVLGAALLRGVAQIEARTLDVMDHGTRLRNDVWSIHHSGLAAVDMLFDPAMVPTEAMALRPVFESFIERERARAYHRAGWHSLAWRSFRRAAALSPWALLTLRNVRRAAVSLACDLLRLPEGPVKTPPATPLIGHGPALWKDSIGFLKRCGEDFGPVARLRLRPRTYLLSDPLDGQHVLVKNAQAYHKTGILRIFPLLAQGYIGLNPPEHAEKKRAMPANFGRQAVHGAIAGAADIVARYREEWGRARTVEVARESQAMFVEIAGRHVIGCHDAARMRELMPLLTDAHQCSRRELRARYRWPFRPAPSWFPLRRRRRLVHLRDRITAWLQRELDEHHALEGNDMLAGMRRALPAEQRNHAAVLRDPILMIFLGAMEPVSITLAWALELLADHPAAQDRVAEESERVLCGAMATGAHLGQLAFTANVVSETARLYPNEWLMTRRAVADDRLPSGLRVRRGEEVFISPFVYGHDARFFPEPERFDPDRFSRSPTWPEEAYIPFGAGPRTCLGERIARGLLTTVLATLVGRYRFEAFADGRGRLESPNLFASQQADNRLVLNVERRVSRQGVMA